MWSIGVAVDSPVLDDLPRHLGIGEQVLVQTRVAQLSTEALHEAILHRRATDSFQNPGHPRRAGQGVRSRQFGLA